MENTRSDREQSSSQTSQISVETPIQSENDKKTTQYPAGIIILLSFVFGVVGGLYGSLDLANRSVFQNWFGKGQSNNQSQNLVISEQSAITEVVQKAGPSVVSIIVSKDVQPSGGLQFGPFGFFRPAPDTNAEPNIQQVGAGTGFFVSADGIILTNRHVVIDETAEYSVVTNEGKTFPAKVLSRDSSNDLALIKIEINQAPFLEFADSSQLQLGQHVVAIGNSLGEYQNTVTTGVVSGINRDIFASGGGGSEQLEGVIQTDAAINPGNSGGPLLNLSAQVVGINTAIDRQGQLVGFAITSNDAKAALDSYLANGAIVRPFLGVRYVMINPAIVTQRELKRDYGALLLPGDTANSPAVLPNSPAANAGLKDGDIILDINNQRLTEQDTLSQVLKQYKPGDKIKLKVFSNQLNQERDVEITIGER